MGDNYEFKNSQIGAVGHNAKAENNTFQQANYVIPDNLDFDLLTQQLGDLKASLRETAQTPEEYGALQKVSQAEEEAKKKNGTGVIKFLKEGGKWLFDSATKIGVSLVTELIKNNM